MYFYFNRKFHKKDNSKKMNFKLLIFDMDGTLYDLNDVLSMNYSMQIAFFSRKTKMDAEEAIRLFNKNGIFPYICKESKSATEFFASNGLSKIEWNNFRESHFDIDKINVTKAVDSSCIVNNSQRYKLVLLTSNSYNNVVNILERLSIPLSSFTEIVTSDICYNLPNFNKKDAMRLISSKYGIPFSSILSIGDRYSTDIAPMLELGGYGALLKSPQWMHHLLDDINNDALCSNTYYEYYSTL